MGCRHRIFRHSPVLVHHLLVRFQHFFTRTNVRNAQRKSSQNKQDTKNDNKSRYDSFKLFSDTGSNQITDYRNGSHDRYCSDAKDNHIKSTIPNSICIYSSGNSDIYKPAWKESVEKTNGPQRRKGRNLKKFAKFSNQFSGKFVEEFVDFVGAFCPKVKLRQWGRTYLCNEGYQSNRS